MVFWKKFFNFFGTTCNGFRLSCRVVKEGNEGKCGANAQGEKGETRRGERREWEGQAARQAAAPLSLPFSPLSVCPPCLSSSRCTRCSERATSLARSPTLRVSSLCVRRNALLVRASTRTEGQKQCAHFSPFVRSSFHLWAMHRDEFVWMQYD